MAKVKQQKIRLKQGDRVRVIAGRSKGVEGRILAVFKDSNRVLVEGVNIIKKAQRPTQNSPQGGIAEIEAPIHVSNVQIIDPKTSNVTRIAYEYDEAGKHRVSAKSGIRLDE